MRAKTQRMLDVAVEVLTEHCPLTVRQVYYQLVARQIIDNSRTQYQAVSNLLVDARKVGTIPWKWIEDRLRRPRAVSMWSGLDSFAETARRAYRRNVWETQPGYLEVWLEKDALSGIFEDLLVPDGVTLNVGRGYDGWDSIHNAAARLGDGSTVLYFGDFDPSGEDMVRSLRERLGFFDCEPDLAKCALNLEDVTRYDLPPDFTKKTDSRAAAFVARFGDVSVELDALPVDVLRDRIRSEVEARMDLAALAVTQRQEEHDRARLIETLRSVARGDFRTSQSYPRGGRAEPPPRAQALEERVIVYTYGYSGGGVPPLQRLAAAGVLIVDIRNAPTSKWHPEYRKARLEKVLGDRYRYLGDLGNINHRDRALSIVLRNTERGLAALAELMAANEVCIVCGCADWRECHRELVGRLMQERLPGLEVVHLDAGEIARRWALGPERTDV